MMVLLPSRAPFVPTRAKVTTEIADIIGPLPTRSVFYDLGCGDARMLVEMAKRNPDAQFIGIEFQFIPFLLAKYRTRGTNIRIIRGMFEKHDLSEATHIYAYLYHHVMNALLPKFEKELSPGAVVYVLDFKLAEREEDRMHLLDSREKGKLGSELYVYTF
ncbi:MAG: methylase [Parcubacteria group bacterium]|nr:methylase [Parcubacteria group bacterium]